MTEDEVAIDSDTIIYTRRYFSLGVKNVSIEIVN